MKYNIGKFQYYRQGVLYPPESIVELLPGDKPGRNWKKVEDSASALAVRAPPPAPEQPVETVRTWMSKKPAPVPVPTQQAPVATATPAAQPEAEKREAQSNKKRPSDVNPL